MRARLAPALLVAALLVATSVAFVVTEKLKLTRNPIVAPVVDKTFAPTCDCATAAASIRFGLRRPDRVDVEIVDGEGDVVRELARSRRQGRPPVTYLWDGRDDDGRIVAEGVYRPRVHLDRQRRTIVMYNRIRVDTTPPRIVSFTARPLVISPDGDGRFDRRIRYRVGERASVELYVDGTRALRRLGTRTTGTMDWLASPAASRCPRGRTRCGSSPATSRATSALARALARFGSTSSRSVATGSSPRWWRCRDPRSLAGADAPLAARRALGEHATGHDPAPRAAGAGKYVLEVEANGNVKRAAIVVAGPTP